MRSSTRTNALDERVYVVAYTVSRVQAPAPPTFVGVDGCKLGWVAVAVDSTGFVAAHTFPTFDAVLLAHPHAATIAVDMPIGLVDAPCRAADQAARDFLKSARSSVFNAPARSVLAAATYEQARALSNAVCGKSLSAQSFALLPRIREVDLHADDPRVFEVHPEVSFRLMNPAPLLPKKSWGGLQARLQRLADQTIRLPTDLGDANLVGIDDVVDAAAAAWSAARIALGSARTFPAPPSQHTPSGRPIAIWA
jgi:predicted RNase H-like nuclease